RDDGVHRLVPRRLHQAAPPAHQGSGEPVGRGVGLPAEEVLGAESAMVDAVRAAAPDADDPVVLDGDVERVAVGVEDGGGLDPAVDVVGGEPLLEMGVDTYGPRRAAGVGGAC